jgi:fatty-acyl-CoA synthase
MIISGGMNIYAAEIERAIGELDGVAEVGVIGVPDPKWGETPAAIVRLDGPVTADEILAHCRKDLASYKLPHYIEFAEEPLPRSMGNKLLKERLRERYGDLDQRRTPDIT